MYHLINVACLLVAAGLCRGSAIDLGHEGVYAGLGHHGYAAAAPVITAPIIAPAAVSAANLVKAAPVPVIKAAVGPVYTAPVIRTVAPVVSALPVGYTKDHRWGGYGIASPYLGALAHGYGDWGYDDWGHKGLGYGHGWGYGHGLGYGHGWGYGHGLRFGHGLGYVRGLPIGHGLGYGYGLDYGHRLGYSKYHH